MTGEPVYLTESLHSYEPQLRLRSSSLNLLTVPCCRTKSGRRRFSVAAPRVWNSLLVRLRTDYDSLRAFNKKQSEDVLVPPRHYIASVKQHLVSDLLEYGAI